jgi:hypothetical protein
VLPVVLVIWLREQFLTTMLVEAALFEYKTRYDRKL